MQPQAGGRPMSNETFPTLAGDDGDSRSAAAAGGAAARAGVARAGPLHADAALVANRCVDVVDLALEQVARRRVHAGVARRLGDPARSSIGVLPESVVADSIDGGSGETSRPVRVSMAVSSTPGSVGWDRSPTVRIPSSARSSKLRYSTARRRNM